MKRHMKWISALGVLLSTGIIPQSCSKDDGYDPSLLFPNAIVTLKPTDGTPSFYIQLDDETTLEPSNIMTSPLGEEEGRALINFTETDEVSEKYDKKVYVNWIDPVLTKALVKDLGEENDEKYGSDPVEIADSWVNIAEDGYLTLQFITYFGNSGIAHEDNLLNAGTEDDPYVVEFRHNAHGDYSSSYGSGIAAFRLDGLEDGLGLPDTNGETVDLTLKYKSFGGEKSIKFKYCTRKTTEEGNIDTDTEYSLKLR